MIKIPRLDPDQQIAMGEKICDRMRETGENQKTAAAHYGLLQNRSSVYVRAYKRALQNRQEDRHVGAAMEYYDQGLPFAEAAAKAHTTETALGIALRNRERGKKKHFMYR
jgi:hypothetical protein